VMSKHAEYSVLCRDAEERVVLRGVLRLHSPAAFEELFAPISTRIERGETLHLDLSEVSFMNSSGIRALAMLVLQAKERGARLRLTGSTGIPWQKKTLHSLSAISPKLEIDIATGPSLDSK
jgi:anti-anti-sigma factor